MMMVVLLLDYCCWWEHLGASAADWIERYGATQLVLIVTLSAITIFRREMSCNHVYYHQKEEEDGEETEETTTTTTTSTTSSTASTDDDANLTNWNEEMTEELLEGAGRYCSGACLGPVLECLKDSIEELEQQVTVPPVGTPEELLEGAGCFCSGYPYTKALLHRPEVKRGPAKPFLTNLPWDAQVHVLAFLHPKDLLNVACVNQDCHELIDQGETSNTIWKRLWHRDYAWLLHSWHIGRLALERSHSNAATRPPPPPPPYSKEFYFRFSLAYTNYLLAGQNTLDHCLVGIGGHIYDLSLFLLSHPGSPETVMAHAGQEATAFFDGMNHSMGARRIARSLCVVVDRSFVHQDACGTRPTKALAASNSSISNASASVSSSSNATSTTTAAAAATTNTATATDLLLPPAMEAPVTFNSQTGIRKKGTLQKIQDAFEQEKKSYRLLVESLKVPELLGDINLYYDPMQQKWKAWYTNKSLKTVFLDQLNAEQALY